MVREVFEAAAELLDAWPPAEDAAILGRVRVFGAEGDAAVALFLHPAEERPLLTLFDDLAAYQAFDDPGAGDADDVREHVGATTTVLTFAAAHRVSHGLRAEARTHGWPIPDAHAFPRIETRSPRGRRLPLTAARLQTMIVAARGLARLRESVPAGAYDTVSIPATSWTRGGLLDWPHPDLAPLDDGLPDAEPPDGPHGESPHHVLDRRLLRALIVYGKKRFGPRWAWHSEPFDDPADAVSLIDHFAAYDFEVDGETVADAYSRERGDDLHALERGWLESQRAAWLSVWEVLSTQPGTGVLLRDRLTGVERFANEVAGSYMMTPKSLLLGRVVTHDGSSVLCGVHPRVLSPTQAAPVLEAAERRLRKRPPIPPERLRGGTLPARLVRDWEDAIALARAKAAAPVILQNTDGDPLVLTRDELTGPPAALDALAAALADDDDIIPPDDADEDDADPRWAVTRPGNAMHPSWENTIVGHLTFVENGLIVEANSTKRADDLLAWIDALTPGAFTHVDRRQEVPETPANAMRRDARGQASDLASPRDDTPDPDLLAVLREMKTKMYASWPDTPLPALDGQTARTAVRTKQGRRRVATLLDEMEYSEQRLPAAERYDFEILRQMLGLSRSP